MRAHLNVVRQHRFNTRHFLNTVAARGTGKLHMNLYDRIRRPIFLPVLTSVNMYERADVAFD
jgi:hypothetical protein